MAEFEITERTEPLTLDEVFGFIDDTNISKMDAHELKSRIADSVKAIREKAIDDAIEIFLEYGCVCVEWNKSLSKEKLVDDVIRQVIGQVVYKLEKLKGGAE